MTRFLKRAAIVLAIALIAGQFVRPSKTNPAADPSASFEAVAKPPKDVAAIIDRACRDCHTNRTAWPWYSNISPVSWLVAADVTEGRNKLNFSQWNIYGPEMSRIKLRQACEEVKAGKMPLPYYTPLHPETKLNPKEADAICNASQ